MTRYVYWRGPDGKPCKKNGGMDSANAPGSLLAELGKSSWVDNGTVATKFHGVFDTFFDRQALAGLAAVMGPDGKEVNDVDTFSSLGLVSPPSADIVGGATLSRRIEGKHHARACVRCRDVDGHTVLRA